MSLDYDKIKKSEAENGTQWASYSDLFMVLSFIFLLLYVTSSLRNGTSSLQKNVEYSELAHENEDLKQQLRAYDTLKEDYLKKGASNRQQKDYKDLMSHLTLLQEEAKDEKDDLRRKAAENEKKEKALNQYQQMIRNIVNSNMVARARIKKRDTVISEKDETIVVNKKELRKKSGQIARHKKTIQKIEGKVVRLEGTVKKKEQLITKNQEKVDKIKEKMDQEVARLNQSYKEQVVSRKQALRKIAKLKRKSTEEIKKLEGQTKLVEGQLSRINDKLDNANQKILQASVEIEKNDQERDVLKQKFEEELANKEKVYSSKLADLDGKYEEKIGSAKEKYDTALKKQKKGYKKQSKRSRRRFAANLKKAKSEYDSLQKQVRLEKGKLVKELRKTKVAMKDAKQGHDRVIKETKVKHSIALAKERAKTNARKRLVEQIKANFKKAGLKAKIDGKTGDVVLAFGHEYFDTGKHTLKPGMVKIIKKFIPAYSKSLFENKKLADRIEAIEIIGFASPTYRGKYIDPNSLSPKDRTAVSYNLDLSYRRAKAIFTHIFDTTIIKYKHQKKLYGMSKVTGRSFLGSKKRSVASDTINNKYCSSNNCKESQRVIIKFNLKN